MKLPKEICIGAHKYTVEERESARMPGKDCYGQVDIGPLIIIIESGLPSSRTVEVLIHECLHAMLQGTELDNEETFVGILGEAITLFIKNNPSLIRSLSSALRDV